MIAQTICQLIRANRRAKGVPCLSVRDWPSLRWRGFQNDIPWLRKAKSRHCVIDVL